MGWLNEFEQQAILSAYGVLAQYKCNYCRQPIFITELMVVDHKGGYLPKPKDDFRSPRAKKTYHRKCDALKRGRPLKDFQPAGLAMPIKKESAPKKVKVKKERKRQEETETKPKAAKNGIREAKDAIIDRLRKKPQRGYWKKSMLVVSVFKRTRIDKALLRKAVHALIIDNVIRKDGKFLSLRKGT